MKDIQTLFEQINLKENTDGLLRVLIYWNHENDLKYKLAYFLTREDLDQWVSIHTFVLDQKKINYQVFITKLVIH